MVVCHWFFLPRHLLVVTPDWVVWWYPDACHRWEMTTSPGDPWWLVGQRCADRLMVVWHLSLGLKDLMDVSVRYLILLELWWFVFFLFVGARVMLLHKVFGCFVTQGCAPRWSLSVSLFLTWSWLFYSFQVSSHPLLCLFVSHGSTNCFFAWFVFCGEIYFFWWGKY